MTASLAPVFIYRPLDVNGNPLPGGKLWSCAAGTTTPLATYTDQTGATPAANPLILDANGQTALWIGNASYKFNLLDANDVQQPGYPKDNVQSAAGIISDAATAIYTAMADTTTVGNGDAKIGVKSTLTGSKARTQHDKNADEVNVLDFSGVDPTGATSSASAFQAAINGANGRRIRIPAGTWFAAELADTASHCLIGCTVAPGFEFADFELAAGPELAGRYPAHAARIARMTRHG